MGARSPKAIKFRAKLGFKQYDITLKTESSVLESERGRKHENSIQCVKLQV